MLETDLFAFYGSMRNGMSNNRIYKSSLEYISTGRIIGFELYALEDYPYAVQSGNAFDSIVVEIFKVTSQEVMRDIHQLELKAGYIFELIEIEGKNVGIYLFEEAANNPKVNNGDWAEFFGILGD